MVIAFKSCWVAFVEFIVCGNFNSKVIVFHVVLSIHSLSFYSSSCFVKSVQLNDQRFRGEGVKFKCKVRKRNVFSTTINLPLIHFEFFLIFLEF